MEKLQLRHGSLFSGIGGFDLAATWVGWRNIFHCELNPFCQQILNYYYPEAKSYENIKTTDFREQKGKIDILTGGFPCQPYSVAGKRLGTDDSRHLWPDIIPIPNSNYYPVKNGLLRGDLVPVTLSNEKKVLLEANPEGKTINVYTPDKRLIPTNFQLDPDWKPQQIQPQQPAEKERTKQTIIPKNAPKKRKGRGI